MIKHHFRYALPFHLYPLKTDVKATKTLKKGYKKQPKIYENKVCSWLKNRALLKMRRKSMQNFIINTYINTLYETTLEMANSK